MTSLEDAMDALDRLESLYGLDDSHNASTLRQFLESLRAKLAPVSIPTDEEGFILEGAMQHGFDLIDDDATLYVVGAQALIDYTKRQRGAP